MQLVEKTSDELLGLFDESLEQTLHFVHTSLKHTGGVELLVGHGHQFPARDEEMDLHFFLFLDMP